MNTRRDFTKGALASLAAAFAASGPARAATNGFSTLRDKPLAIAVLIFERMDQIDFTGPFSVLSRLPNASLTVLSNGGATVRDETTRKNAALRLELAHDIARELAGDTTPDTKSAAERGLAQAYAPPSAPRSAQPQ